MQDNPDDIIPEDIKDRFAKVSAQFMIDWNVEQDAVTMFVMQIIEIYEDYMKRRLLSEQERTDIPGQG